MEKILLGAIQGRLNPAQTSWLCQILFKQVLLWTTLAVTALAVTLVLGLTGERLADGITVTLTAVLNAVLVQCFTAFVKRRNGN